MNLNERIEIKKDNFDEIRDEEILKLHLNRTSHAFLFLKN